MKKTTKDKILTFLKKEVSLTVNDLTERLDITHMAVRKHLNILEKEELISSKEVKQPMGRPIQTYLLTEKGERVFPKNYEGISMEFLHDIEQLHGEETILQLFKQRENRLRLEYSLRLSQKRESLDKMNEIVSIQNEKGYMANLTQLDEHTFEMIEYNCPILEIAKTYKVACQCETSMFKQVLKTDHVNRTCCKTDGDNHCKFLVKFQ